MVNEDIAAEVLDLSERVGALKYGEYGTGDTEKLAKQRERQRQREMEDKFPDYGKAQMDQKLEDWGVYIDPDLRGYKGQTVERPEGLKYIYGIFNEDIKILV